MTGLHSCAIGALILTAATAAYSQVHYTIKGELPEAEGLTVYMIDYDNNATIDSAAVKNGNFILQGDYNRDAYVRINAGREYSNCILDSLVTVDFNTHIAKPGTSTINDTLKQYLDMEEEYFSRGMALRDSCLSAGVSETEAGQYFHDNYYLNESPKLQEKIRNSTFAKRKLRVMRL